MIWMIATAYGMPSLSFVSSEGVNYADVRSDVRFQQWLTTLPTLDIPTQSTNAQKAFGSMSTMDSPFRQWLTICLSTVYERLDDGQVWTTRTYIVGGQTMTLDNMKRTYLDSSKIQGYTQHSTVLQKDVLPILNGRLLKPSWMQN